MRASRSSIRVVTCGKSSTKKGEGRALKAELARLVEHDGVVDDDATAEQNRHGLRTAVQGVHARAEPGARIPCVGAVSERDIGQLVRREVGLEVDAGLRVSAVRVGEPRMINTGGLRE